MKRQTTRSRINALCFFCCGCDLLSGLRRARATRGGMRFAQLVFSDRFEKSMFWHLLALLIGGQVSLVHLWPQISTDEWLDKKRLFDEKAE